VDNMMLMVTAAPPVIPAGGDGEDEAEGKARSKKSEEDTDTSESPRPTARTTKHRKKADDE